LRSPRPCWRTSSQSSTQTIAPLSSGSGSGTCLTRQTPSRSRPPLSVPAPTLNFPSWVHGAANVYNIEERNKDSQNRKTKGYIVVGCCYFVRLLGFSFGLFRHNRGHLDDRLSQPPFTFILLLLLSSTLLLPSSSSYSLFVLLPPPPPPPSFLPSSSSPSFSFFFSPSFLLSSFSGASI